MPPKRVRPDDGLVPGVDPSFAQRALVPLMPGRENALSALAPALAVADTVREGGMHWMLLALRRFSDFKGRSRRREYWMFVLLVFATILLAGMVMIVARGSFRTQGEFATAFTVWAGFAMVPLIVPLLAVTVRRLHDLGLSGWWLLVLPIGAAIPAIDALVPFAHMIVMALPGRRRANRFGENPKPVSGT